MGCLRGDMSAYRYLDESQYYTVVLEPDDVRKVFAE